MISYGYTLSLGRIFCHIIFLVDLVVWVSFVNKTIAIFLSLKTVKRAFANKIKSSCDIKLGAVVSFVIRCAESGVAVAARPTILHG